MEAGTEMMELDEAIAQKFFEGDPGCDWPIGSNVIKIASNPGDRHDPGMVGVVKGSLLVPTEPDVPPTMCYLIEFESEGGKYLTFYAHTMPERMKLFDWQ